jgi:hypothetical protein
MTDTTQTHYQVTCTDYTDHLSKPEPEIILIGTAHVSKKSVTEVKEVIAREHPSVVAVELCPGRYAALKGKTEDVSAKDILGGGNITLFLVHSLLAYLQNKIGADMEVKPGSEMIAAIDAAEEPSPNWFQNLKSSRRPPQASLSRRGMPTSQRTFSISKRRGPETWLRSLGQDTGKG